jgi:microcystin-dependent protein
VSTPFVGEIRLFAGNFAPSGWALCNGAVLPISENETLYTLIGTTYGGDGVTTFALPNLCSRVPLHQGSGFAMGQSAGGETVTLTTAQMPVHSHAAAANATAATSGSPQGNVWANGGSSQFSDQPPDAQLSPATLQPAGGNQPHDNMLPFLAVNFIISLFGVFPSQT